MKIFRTNINSIKNGILKELFPKSKFTRIINEIWEIDNHYQIKNNFIIKIDNRIKGYCLKEYN